MLVAVSFQLRSPMGALPKRRISSARRGKRRAAKNLTAKIVKHHKVPSHKKGLVANIQRLLGNNA